MAFRAIEGCKILERFRLVKWNKGNMQLEFRKGHFLNDVTFWDGRAGQNNFVTTAHYHHKHEVKGGSTKKLSMTFEKALLKSM